MTFTDRDLREQVTASLGTDVADFDVPGVVDEIQAVYGTVPIDQVPTAIYWEIVERHAVDEEDRHGENLRRWNANHAE
jgi:hypothetical protein